MVRELARWDVSRYDEICQWPLREALASYQALLRQETAEEYRTQLLCYAVQRPWAPKGSKPPEPPEILR